MIAPTMKTKAPIPAMSPRSIPPIPRWTSGPAAPSPISTTPTSINTNPIGVFLSFRACGESGPGLRPAASAGANRTARGETEGKVAPRSVRPAAPLSLGLGPQAHFLHTLLTRLARVADLDSRCLRDRLFHD